MVTKKRTRGLSKTRLMRSQLMLGTYLALGEGRSLREARQIAIDAGVARVPSEKTLQRWSAADGWVAAATNYDSRRSEEAAEFVLEEALSVDARHMATGRAFLELAAKGASLHMAALDTEESDELPPLQALARIGDIGFRMERLASGLATSRVEHVVEVINMMLMQMTAVFVEATALLVPGEELTPELLDRMRGYFAQTLDDRLAVGLRRLDVGVEAE